MAKSYTIVGLVGVALLSLVLTFYNQNETPPCFNADEAAFGYNAYSIARTGKDEHGAFLPLRLTSFGDYKLPLYSYLSAPFVSIMGLSITSIRFLNYIVALCIPIAVYYLTKELFEKQIVAWIASFLSAISLPIHILTRHAHEAPLAMLLTTVATIFLVKSIREITWRHTTVFIVTTAAALFTYHPSRIFALFFVLCIAVAIPRHRTRGDKLLMASLVTIIVLFGITDVMIRPERVSNLLFINDYGLTLRINEMRGDGAARLTHNKWIIGLKDVVLAHTTYYSPQFLLMHGDENIRFGYPHMGIMSLAEYVFLLVGLFYLFKNNHRWRFFLVALILIAPVSASLSWAGQSLTRSLFMVIPFFAVSAYGAYSLWNDISNYKRTHGHCLSRYLMHSLTMRVLYICFIVVGGVGYTWYNWTYYLYSYPNRAQTIRAWQCGYEEVIETVKRTYNTMEHFYITREIGQPYIFILFGLAYEPSQYHPHATLSPPDEYGFGQVEQFDKFTFHTNIPEDAPRPYMVIGTGNDFSLQDDVTDVIVGTEHIFSIKVVE